MSFFHIFVHTDGHGEGFFGADKVSASVDSPNAVFSKDVVIVPEKGPPLKQTKSSLFYYHGGGLFMGSPFCSTYHNYVGSHSAKANPLNTWSLQLMKTWAALKWVASHFKISAHGYETGKTLVLILLVFLLGNSAGGNIVHSVAFQASFEDLNGIKLSGICLVQPYFGRNYGVVDNCWVICIGFNDVRIKSAADSGLRSLRCPRVLVCVTEKDNWRDGTLKNCGWAGETEIVETEGDDHVFHLFNPDSEKAVALMDKLASFLNQDNHHISLWFHIIRTLFRYQELLTLIKNKINE
ncbi:hypothetical protein CUMW_273620 [Citrus unshiu]|uniref:Alpha/beta hydrolase fold-3 domain-containing protein n=1 Tax=Citrus unshiu TaxID=55188 RepID=A0A2H5MWL5_CITUN|nr:hypothetical protein CUMW_273620 [Citrus unshiu]